MTTEGYGLNEYLVALHALERGSLSDIERIQKEYKRTGSKLIPGIEAFKNNEELAKETTAKRLTKVVNQTVDMMTDINERRLKRIRALRDYHNNSVRKTHSLLSENKRFVKEHGSCTLFGFTSDSDKVIKAFTLGYTENEAINLPYEVERLQNFLKGYLFSSIDNLVNTIGIYTNHTLGLLSRLDNDDEDDISQDVRTIRHELEKDKVEIYPEHPEKYFKGRFFIAALGINGEGRSYGCGELTDNSVSLANLTSVDLDKTLLKVESMFNDINRTTRIRCDNIEQIVDNYNKAILKASGFLYNAKSTTLLSELLSSLQMLVDELLDLFEAIYGNISYFIQVFNNEWFTEVKEALATAPALEADDVDEKEKELKLLDKVREHLLKDQLKILSNQKMVGKKYDRILTKLDNLVRLERGEKVVGVSGHSTYSYMDSCNKDNIMKGLDAIMELADNYIKVAKHGNPLEAYPIIVKDIEFLGGMLHKDKLVMAKTSDDVEYTINDVRDIIDKMSSTVVYLSNCCNSYLPLIDDFRKAVMEVMDLVRNSRNGYSEETKEKIKRILEVNSLIHEKIKLVKLNLYLYGAISDFADDVYRAVL